MMRGLEDLWYMVPTGVQDGAILAALLLPVVLLAALLWRGFAPGVLVASFLRREWRVAGIFVALIAVSVAAGVAVIAQDRALRTGSARAAAKFDLIVAAPGSEMTAMLAAVFLQPEAVPLVDGETFAAIAAHPRVRLAAPLAFGDSWQGAPVVGSTAAFVLHLADGALAEGRMFAGVEEALAGARSPLRPGDRFAPAHGAGHDADADAHDVDYTVVGRLPPTGSPWDRALIVPVESVWAVHGLADGHAPENAGQLGPPFDAAYFPGTPAVLVRGETLADAYGLRATFDTDRTMAFFPGTVLAQLHALLGDVRTVMSVLSVLTQILVAAATLAGLAMLVRLLARRIALLRTLGAPDRFVVATIWSVAAALIGLGAVLGLGLGFLATGGLSAVIAARTDIALDPALGWTELHLVAGFICAAGFLSLLPALAAVRREVLSDLRS